MLIMLLFVAVVSFAWFYNNRQVTIGNGSQMTVTVGSKLEVALSGEGVSNAVWGNKIEADSQANIMDCSGDGTDFYYPLALDGNDQPIENAFFPVFNDEDDGLAEQTYLLQYRFKLRTTSKIDVFLSGSGGVANTGSSVYPHPGENPSMFGSFSSNYIAGCARVAFYEITTVDGIETQTLKYVWVPNSQYQIKEENNQYTFTTEGDRETYKYVTYNSETQTYDEVAYTVQDYLNGTLFVADNAHLANVTTGNVGMGLPILRFDEEGVEQTKEIAVRIWFEGTDREAHSALNRGIINYRLHFAGFRRKDDPAQTDIDKMQTLVWSKNDLKLYYPGYDADGADKTQFYPTNVVYSFNGIDWYSYDPTIYLDVKDRTTMYIRLKETTSTYPSRAYHTVSLVD